MDKIKKYAPTAIIILLLLFGMSKCTQSCNRSTKLTEQETTLAQRDSVIKVLNDSITALNHRIDLLTNDKTNQEKLIESQKESIDKINEAKKNINVTVKK